MIEIVVKDDGIAAGLAQIAAGFRSPRRLMGAISELFAGETEANFAAQGRPKWLGLKPPVAKRRVGGMILQDSNQLAASISSAYGADFALVGSNKRYARIHQLGGQTPAHVILPRNKKALAFAGRIVRKVNHPGSKIPARPFLPVDTFGNLQPTAREGVVRLTNNYLASLLK